MSDFSKNYYSPKDKHQFLSVTWEVGYYNVNIYHQGRLIKSFASPGPFVEGIQFEDEELGKISIKFTTVGPKMLEVKVNRKKYKTINKNKLGYDFSGLIAMFSSLAIFASIGLAIFLGAAEFNIQAPIIKTVFIIDLIIIAIYATTSILLSKKKPWAYFLGASLFLLTSIFAILNAFAVGMDMMIIGLLIFRLAMLSYIILQGKHIINEMKRLRESTPDKELIDDQL